MGWPTLELKLAAGGDTGPECWLTKPPIRSKMRSRSSDPSSHWSLVVFEAVIGLALECKKGVGKVFIIQTLGHNSRPRKHISGKTQRSVPASPKYVRLAQPPRRGPKLPVPTAQRAPGPRYETGGRTAIPSRPIAAEISFQFRPWTPCGRRELPISSCPSVARKREPQPTQAFKPLKCLQNCS